MLGARSASRGALGTAARLGDMVWSRSRCGWRDHDGLEFDGRQMSEAVQSAPPVVGPFDPGDDRDAQLFSRGPGASVENVLLKECEERFHGCAVARGADSAHGSDHAVSVQSPHEALGSQLRSAVRVKHAVADDPVGVDALIAQRYSLPSAVQRSVMLLSQNSFGSIGGEFALHEVIVRGRSGPLPLALLGLLNALHQLLSRQIATRSDRPSPGRRREPSRPRSGSRTRGHRDAWRRARWPDTPRRVPRR